MKNRLLRCGGVVVWLMLMAQVIRANHLVGGFLQMTNVNGEPGHYKMKLTYYYDLANGTQSITPRLLFVIFRKSDNQRMDSLSVFATSTNKASLPKITVKNPECLTGRAETQWGVVTYERDVQLDPNRYTDSGGYYMANQDCCRSNGSVNLSGTQVGFTFYLEFPPMTGATNKNSSPVFSPIEPKVLCVNKPDFISAAATDPDGNPLRYSLVAPYRGNVTSIANLYTNALIPGPFAPITFTTGYTATNPIASSPPVQINAQTGQITVTPTAVGDFIFTVRVEELLNGQPIGETRQDYRITVVDCPPEKPPVPAVAITNQPTSATTVALCNGNTATLVAQQKPEWKLQWQKDGVNIPGETSPILSVTAAGSYQVVNSFTSNCGQSNASKTLVVTTSSQTAKIDPPAKTSLCPGADAVALTISGFPSSYTYTWYYNGAPISGLNSNTQTVSKPGQYSAILNDPATGCSTKTDAVTLTQASSPTATVSAANNGILCERDSLQLTATGGSTYQWFLNDNPIAGRTSPTLVVSRAGSYRVTATDANGCKGNSNAQTVTVRPRTKPTVEVISPVCGTTAPAVSLRGSPPGGSFSGPGVSGTTFNPAAAGLGSHTIVYTAPTANGCPGDTTRQTVRVNQLPVVQLPDRIVTSRQGVVELRPTISGSGPFSYTWRPTIWLSNPSQATVTVTFPQTDTTYTLRVRDASGCEGEASVRILLQQKLSIPDVFTPNNDQLNDTWKLFGIESFPTAQVTVFSRWGEVVFQSTNGYLSPFDGVYLGQPLPAGMYLYVLKLSPEAEPLRGAVWLMR